MRTLLACPLGRLLESLRSGGRGRRIFTFCFVLCLAGGLAVAGDAGGREYSAFADSEKPAISFLLSEKENVRDLRQTFGLDEQQTEKVIYIVRAENERLAEEYAESEELVAANRSLPDDKISEKIAASDYDETISSAIEETKEGVADVLPEAERDGLAAWVDEHWRKAVAESSEGDSGRMIQERSGRVLICDRIFATQYIGYTRFEAALPHKGLKFGSRPKVPIKRGQRTIRPRIKEVGPWNIRDNYWRSGRQRSMWRDLPRCKPEAEAAYFREYNRGKDQFGREVLNPAGVDLTPAAARRLGLAKYENAWVDVRFPWISR